MYLCMYAYTSYCCIIRESAVFFVVSTHGGRKPTVYYYCCTRRQKVGSSNFFRDIYTIISVFIVKLFFIVFRDPIVYVVLADLV